MTASRGFCYTLLQASQSRKHSRVLRISTSVKCNPVGISSNISMTSLLAYPSVSPSRPPNLPLRTVPSPGDVHLSAMRIDPDNDKLFKFFSCAITSRKCVRPTMSALTVKDVTECGSRQNKGIQNLVTPNKVTLSTFVNRGVYGKNCSGTLL